MQRTFLNAVFLNNSFFSLSVMAKFTVLSILCSSYSSPNYLHRVFLGIYLSGGVVLLHICVVQLGLKRLI